MNNEEWHMSVIPALRKARTTWGRNKTKNPKDELHSGSEMKKVTL